MFAVGTGFFGIDADGSVTPGAPVVHHLCTLHGKGAGGLFGYSVAVDKCVYGVAVCPVLWVAVC